MKKIIRIFVLFVAFVFMFNTVSVKAEEVNNDAVNEQAEVQEQVETEEQITRESPNEILTDDDGDEEYEDETDDLNRRAAVVINKLDEDGNYLPGAVLQILDSDGYLVAEWTSENDSFSILLPDGTYTLHEVSAPDGYIKAEDKTFTVEVKLVNMDAGVDWSETPCPHYDGTRLYYVDFDGQKEEVYCINQDWETPDEGSNYDGAILTPEDIRNYLHQTVAIDAHQNKGLVDVSDQSLTDQELYDKILDIIYHRQLASSKFSDLTEAEIRYVTELALKNYTNAGLTRAQRVLTSQVPDNYDALDSYETGRYTWYLYTHFRSFVYLPDALEGSDIFTTSVGNGDAFGTLARHWNDGDHNAKNDPAVRAQVARYYELYQYLVGDTDHHPEDMYLYIFSTDDIAYDTSYYDYDGVYQNLLGVRWANPDENVIELDLINNKKDTGKTEIIPPVTGISTNESNSSLLIVLMLVLGLSMSLKRRFN